MVKVNENVDFHHAASKLGGEEGAMLRFWKKRFQLEQLHL